MRSTLLHALAFMLILGLVSCASNSTKGGGGSGTKGTGHAEADEGLSDDLAGRSSGDMAPGGGVSLNFVNATTGDVFTFYVDGTAATGRVLPGASQKVVSTTGNHKLHAEVDGKRVASRDATFESGKEYTWKLWRQR